MYMLFHAYACTKTTVSSTPLVFERNCLQTEWMVVVIDFWLAGEEPLFTSV